MKNIESRDVVFALACDALAAPVTSNVYAVSWTPEVLEVLRQIRKEAEDYERERDEDARLNLPFADLRSRILLQESRWGTLFDHIGLRHLHGGRDEPPAWGFLCGADERTAKEALHRAFSEWVQGALQGYCDQRRAFLPGIARLYALRDLGKVVKFKPARVTLFPWPAGGPAQGASSPFNISAGYLASRLAGREIFPELGPVVRIMGGPDANQAEVMTLPREAEGGRFSLVCEISVETLPGSGWPLVFLQFKRRRWADTMAARPKSRSIGGFVIPHAKRPGAAFRFTLSQRGGDWTTDLGYRYFEQTLDLVEGYDNERVLQYPCDDRASVLVMTKVDVAEAAKSDLNSGVPLVDQADAFARIAEALCDLNLRPFDDFEAVVPPRFKPMPLPMLKAEITLSHLLQRYEENEAEEEAEGSLSGTGGQTIGARFEVATGVPVARHFKDEPQSKDDEAVRASIRTLVAQTAYADQQRRSVIYLLTDTPEDIEWIKTTAHAILGDDIRVVSMALPADTHGPTSLLPEPEGKRRARFEARIRTWEAFVKAEGIPPGIMVLVQAKMLYPVEGGKRKLDDWVNKAAAKKALAMAGCTVQYLLPSEPGRLDKFLPRVQAALLDLVFGHGGLVWGLPQSSEAMFMNEATRPRWVAGIGSLQLQTDWFRNAAVLVATRMECATGRAWVRFGHQEARWVLSDWMPFDEGASYVASRRLELPRKADGKRAAFARFATETLNDIHELDPNAVVFIDSTRTAKLGGGWLADRSVNGCSLEVAPGTFAHERWPGLRLLRIRSQAPSMGQEKIHLNLEVGGRHVRTWTTTPKLFRVKGTPAPTFWSLAKPHNHPKRGASCYRDIVLPNTKPTEEYPDMARLFSARAKEQHANPRAIEVVVLQQQPEDEAMHLVAFAQALRAGMLTTLNTRWVSSPSPLQIIGTLAQYMRA